MTAAGSRREGDNGGTTSEGKQGTERCQDLCWGFAIINSQIYPARKALSSPLLIQVN